MASTHLLYDDALHLYQIALVSKKNLICLDIGSTSTGICVLHPENGSAFALTKLLDYTPFEQAIVDEYWTNAGIAVGDPQPFPKCMVEGQLLPIQCITSAMNTQEKINILNRVG